MAFAVHISLGRLVSYARRKLLLRIVLQREGIGSTQSTSLPTPRAVGSGGSPAVIKQPCQVSGTDSFFCVALCHCRHCTVLHGGTMASLPLWDPARPRQVVILLSNYLTSCISCVGQGAKERSWHWHCSWGMCCLAGPRAERSPARRHAPL